MKYNLNELEKIACQKKELYPVSDEAQIMAGVCCFFMENESEADILKRMHHFLMVPSQTLLITPEGDLFFNSEDYVTYHFELFLKSLEKYGMRHSEKRKEWNAYFQKKGIDLKEEPEQIYSYLDDYQYLFGVLFYDVKMDMTIVSIGIPENMTDAQKETYEIWKKEYLKANHAKLLEGELSGMYGIKPIPMYPIYEMVQLKRKEKI